MSSSITVGLFVILVCGILGFADATYLTILHFADIIPPCSATSGCETVLTSSYSRILGIPVALFGSLYYAGILVGTMLCLNPKNTHLRKPLYLFSSVGLVAAGYFVFLELFVLHALCIYCTASAILSVCIFCTSLYLYHKESRESFRINTLEANS